jgi:hypothetical protein
MITHIETAIQDAMQFKSKLSKEVLDLQGMSTPRIRHFLNNLCANKIKNHLEIGTWKGSTLISAGYHNIAKVTGIDDFSEVHYGVDGLNVKLELENNLHSIMSGQTNWKFINKDCQTITATDLLYPYDSFLYDGNHEEAFQYKGIIEFDKYLVDNPIIMVDDWELAEDVEKGTRRAFKDLKYEILKEWHLKKADGFHEGFYVALVKKPN